MDSSLTESPENRLNKVEWLYKYSDDLANFFGGLFVLCIACILLSIFITVSDNAGKENNDVENLWTIMIISLSIVVAVISLPLTIYFARQAPVFEKHLKEKADKDSIYVISKWKLKTLNAAGVPDDMVEYLTKFLEKSKQKEIQTRISDDSPGNWLISLKTDLGETRVNESLDTILKYTRRKED